MKTGTSGDPDRQRSGSLSIDSAVCWPVTPRGQSCRRVFRERLQRIAFLILRLPGVAITWFSVIKVQIKRALWLPIAPWRKKNAKGFFLRAFSVDGLIQLLSSISLQALPHSSWAGPQYHAARRKMLFLAGTLVHTLYDLNQTRALLAISWKSYNFYSCFNFIKL